SAGLALAYPMDRPVVSRFAYNASTHQYFVVFELGLSQAAKHPGRADVRLLLYQHDPSWGFRAAFAKYVHIYPQFFERRVADDGIWVAHADLDGIPNIADFHIKFHETGNPHVYAYDDSVGAYTLRYLAEPWGYWLRLPGDVPNDDYQAVMDYVRRKASSSIASERRWGEAILSSGTFDASGRYQFEAASEAFASHAAAFILDADPDLQIAGYSATKASQSWSEGIKAPYSHPEWGILDGEYIDSFESRGLYSNYRREHWAFSDLPLTFETASKRVVLPHIFSNYEFAKWVSDDVHSLGKYCMANSVLLRWAFPAHLFDIMGSERGWVHNGRFLPDPDSLLNLWRTFSYRKPYCVLQNGDLPSFTHAMVEQYFAYCAFYGIYPSFFTHDGGVTNYWERSDWYERDRDLYRKYIPKIIALNQAGWEPITHARTDRSQVYIERYGSGDEFYLTLRNTGGDTNVSVSVDLAALGLPASDAYIVREWLTGQSLQPSLVDGKLRLRLEIPAGATRILHIQLTNAPTQYIPLVIGWNLVSVPGMPLSTKVEDLLASLRGKFDRVYAYNAFSGQWLSYDARVPYARKLKEIQPGQGFWIHMLTPATWEVRCFPQTEATIPLYKGWNLVGYPFEQTQSVADAVASLGGRFRTLFGYAAGTSEPWRIFTPDLPSEASTLATLEPGRGYWIEVSEATQWRLQAPN
ncbi:MAG: hypothetical protein J7M05_14390, partial [Anaerolineae bacterium]|nr:hypothetical protein [Anaerolineae bacterium]